jgi:hypothetical protein
MGLLAVDVSRFGVVMSADSQPVELLDGETRVLAQAGERRTRNPILIRDAGGFKGFTGFVGTETIGKRTTRDWLTTFGTSHAHENLSAYAGALGDELTQEWRRLGLSSIIEILISGVEDGEVRFWFVRNSLGSLVDLKRKIGAERRPLELHPLRLRAVEGEADSARSSCASPFRQIATAAHLDACWSCVQRVPTAASLTSCCSARG